ncbi:universal stress protein [Pseudorhodobacter sp.]|uniref:universal stress protein n=1 Tax=Pseudorhodobacter sp. TaxID=1934400 RepID=UPI0026477765|nr:universal stress protein [Pseudorhodobacter sp.]MDN5786596.1 universal stress protein [Pseudorhodobacter sp.]
MFTKILVAVDGSDQSRNAVRYASDLAKKYDAALHLVHAPQIEVETLTLGSGMLDVLPTRDLLAKQGKTVLDQAGAWAEEGGRKADSTEILLGDATQAILKYAAENGIDLIVSGSRGLGALRGLLQGSVSQKLTSHATCPVLTVR